MSDFELQKSNLNDLHNVLKKVFLDYLERMRSQGVDEVYVKKVSDAFVSNEVGVNISTSISNNMMHLSCSIDDQELFKAALDMKEVTYQ